MQLIYTHEVIQHKLDEATERVAVQANLYDTIGTMEVVQTAYDELKALDEELSVEGIKKLLVEEAVNLLGSELLKVTFFDSLEKSSFKPGIIVNGLDGLDFSESSFLVEDDMIRGVVIYKAGPLFSCFDAFEFNVIQVSSSKAWTGYGKKDIKEDVVYKTVNGTVYHRFDTCTYIKIDLTEMAYSNLVGQDPCKACAEGLSVTPTQIVYITKTGRKYHITKSCSKIKRDIIEIKESEIGDLKPCSRCGGVGDK